MANEYILKSFDGGAQTTTLTSGFTIGGGTLTVANGTSFPDGSAGKFVVVVDRGLANEEKFLITSTSGVSNITFTISNAGYDNTSTVNHSIGATVDHCLDAFTVEQANRYVNLQATKGSLVTHTGTTTAAITASATNNLTLLTDSTVLNGIKWAQLPTAGIADGSVTNAKLSLTEVKLRRAAAQTITLSGAYQNPLISWDTEDADVSGFITTPSNTLTVPVGASGLYLWSLRLTADHTSGPDSFIVMLRYVLLNSLNTYASASFSAISTSTPVTTQESSSVYLTAGDTLEFNMRVGAGSFGTGTATGDMTATLWLTRIMD